MRVCSIEGCGREHYGKDYCRRHYKWYVEYGHTEAQNTRCEICSTELTGKRIGRRFCGLSCQMKWHRQSGCYTPERVKASRGICKIDGCDNPVKAKGFCSVHAMREWRHGDANTPIRTTVPCTIQGCLENGGYHGLCKRHYSQQYLRDHRAEYNARNSARRAGLRSATPAWLTKEDWAEIRLIYRQCLKITIATGVEHHVDHVFPLNGHGICGLHVPWNLQVLPWQENQAKSNGYGDDVPTVKVWSNEERAELSKIALGRDQTPFRTPEFRAQVGAISKAAWEDPAYRERMAVSRAATAATDSERSRKSAATKAAWADPERKAARAAVISAARLGQPNAVIWDDSRRQAQSDKMKAVLASPEAKAQRSAAMQARWANPKQRAAILASRKS